LGWIVTFVGHGILLLSNVFHYTLFLCDFSKELNLVKLGCGGFPAEQTCHSIASASATPITAKRVQVFADVCVVGIVDDPVKLIVPLWGWAAKLEGAGLSSY